MHKLTFKNDKANTLAKMLRWANGRPRRIPYSTTITNSQGLLLVKDEGIYLMSPTDKKFRTVVYARGYKPTKTNRDTLWDKTHDVSGDDFAEFVHLDAGQVARVLDGGGITIKLNATTLEIAA
jgi:hypothetical protein